MSDQPETLADIVAQMRRWYKDGVAVVGTGYIADRIEAAVQRFVADDCAKCAHYNAATISLKDALDLANTIANHGINANDLGDKASVTIYALCHEVRTARGEDENIKQEVQKLRRELRALAAPPEPPSNSAALREALEGCMHEMCERCDSYMADNMQTHKPCPGCVIVDKARAALTAPARNCDRFKTEGDAHREYLRIFDHPDPVHYAKWLFAPAEGGAK